MAFLVVEWTNSSSNNYFLAGLASNETKHVPSYMEEGCRDRFVLQVLLNTTQSRSDSPLNVNQKEVILQRDTEGKPLENRQQVVNVYFLPFMKNYIKRQMQT